MSERIDHGGWDDEADEPPPKPLTRDEAQALREANPSISPWRVIAVQAVCGSVVAVLAWLYTGKSSVAWSALYGAATAVVPGALLAHAMMRRLSSMSPGVSAVSFMSWEFVKIGVSVVMLLLAPRLVQSLSWPALLIALVVCIKVYWLALQWRARKA